MCKGLKNDTLVWATLRPFLGKAQWSPGVCRLDTSCKGWQWTALNVPVIHHSHVELTLGHLQLECTETCRSKWPTMAHRKHFCLIWRLYPDAKKLFISFQPVVSLHILYTIPLFTCTVYKSSLTVLFTRRFPIFPVRTHTGAVWNVTLICMPTTISSEITPSWLMAALLPQKPPWAMWYDSPVIRH